MLSRRVSRLQNRVDLLTAKRVIAQEVGAKINVSQAEIRKYYDDHKTDFIREETVFLREILIVPADASPTAWGSAEKKAKKIAVRVRNNEKFGPAGARTWRVQEGRTEAGA